MKQRIDGLVTLDLYGNRDDLDPVSRTIAYPLTDQQKEKRSISVIRHPLVRRHPYTGRKALYAVSGTAFAIDGMPDDEALSLLRELAAHSTQPRYQHRVSHGVGDVVAWDNASVLHSATLTAPKHARTLRRITTKEAGPPWRNEAQGCRSRPDRSNSFAFNPARAHTRTVGVVSR